MKRLSVTIKWQIALLSILLFSSITVCAQDANNAWSWEKNATENPTSDKSGDPDYDWSWETTAIPFAPPPPPTPVPIDGGLSLLLVAGIGYGAASIRRRKK